MTDVIEQGSDAWKAQRIGKVTASRIADLTAKTKTGWGASRANYMAALIAERLTGEAMVTFTNAAMVHGTETEPLARAAYEFMRDCEVTSAGFVDHPKIPMTGASPDGFVGDAGLVEFKCPQTATHLDTLLGGEVPGGYVKQMHWQMACTGRQWCDWVSFDPRLPAPMQLFVRRVPRDNAMIASLEKDVTEFLFELDGKLARLRELYETRAAA